MKKNQKQRRPPAALQPKLRLTPTTWAKLVYLRDAGPTEIGGFGVSSAEDPLLIEDLCLVKQACDSASVVFDDDSVADYFDRQVDRGRSPEQFARVWVHTHPGSSPLPSSTDEETFARVFGSCDWALMLILARGGKSYARLQVDGGVCLAAEIEVAVDYDQPFAGSAHQEWQAEYDNLVEHVRPEPTTAATSESDGRLLLDDWSYYDRLHWGLADDLYYDGHESLPGCDPFCLEPEGETLIDYALE